MPSFLHALQLSATEGGYLRNLILTFLTRPGCHLCDDARPLVLAEAERVGATVEEINIDSHDRLVSVYGIRIPVLLGPEELVLAEGVIGDGKELRRKLRQL